LNGMIVKFVIKIQRYNQPWRSFFCLDRVPFFILKSFLNNTRDNVFLASQTSFQ
jgi:hypothetical protein